MPITRMTTAALAALLAVTASGCGDDAVAVQSASPGSAPTPIATAPTGDDCVADPELYHRELDIVWGDVQQRAEAQGVDSSSADGLLAPMSPQLEEIVDEVVEERWKIEATLVSLVSEVLTDAGHSFELDAEGRPDIDDELGEWAMDELMMTRPGDLPFLSSPSCLAAVFGIDGMSDSDSE